MVNSLEFDRRVVALLGAVFAISVAITFLFTRQQQQPVAAVVPVASAVPASPVVPTASTSPAATQTAEIVVEVVGKVRRPTVVSLPQGSRVLDALEAAGGARPGVDTTDQNLARQLVDGEQIRIGLGPPEGGTPVTGSAADAAQGAVVNLNTASAAQLEQIPGVGPVLAQRILLFREQHGAFTAVEQLTEVSGIGEATFEQMRPMVTVGAGG